MFSQQYGKYVTSLRNDASSYSKEEKSPNSDNIYYNISLLNNNSFISKEAKFSESRTQAILTNPQDYYTALVQFKTSTRGIPLFDTNQTTTISGSDSAFTIVSTTSGSNIITITY